MKINFEIGPNARLAGPGEILKCRPVQTSTSGFLLQGIKHGRGVTLSGVQVKNEYELEIVSSNYYFRKKYFILQIIRGTTKEKTEDGYILAETCS
jgi:hypothetical protein